MLRRRVLRAVDDAEVFPATAFERRLEQAVPGDDRPWNYSAVLGSTAAMKCAYQGYSGRVYCDFDLPEVALGAALPLYVYVNGCGDPIFYHPWVSIFDPADALEEPTEVPVCKADLSPEACKNLGGTYNIKTNECVCP